MRLPLHMPADPILKIPAADSLGQVESQFQINENSNCRGSTVVLEARLLLQLIFAAYELRVLLRVSMRQRP
jgi:hypothetical protein